MNVKEYSSLHRRQSIRMFQQPFETTPDRPITGNLPRMTFCYERHPTDYSAYYIPKDNPNVHGPIPHRPVWKGAESTPRQAPETLIDTPAKDRLTPTMGGFLPHKGEFIHYTGAVDNESSLRNLDQPLTERAFGQRVMFPNMKTLSSHSKMGVSALDARGTYGCHTQTNLNAPPMTTICGFSRRYDDSGDMNSAKFNNSTRLTTRNMVLPIIEQASGLTPHQTGRIGHVPVRRP